MLLQNCRNAILKCIVDITHTLLRLGRRLAACQSQQSDSKHQQRYFLHHNHTILILTTKVIHYFQFTLSAYGPDVERNLPSKNKIIIPTFQQLSKEIGKEKVIWRYDPIFFNEQYSIEYHCKYFEVLASKLGDYTEKCTVSFMDMYRNTERNVKLLSIVKDTYEMQVELLQRFVEIAKEYGLYIDTCAEIGDFHNIGVEHAHCIDRERIERIGGFKLNVDKDTNQRAECGCVASIDIGAYNTCKNGCLYCYANYSSNTVEKNFGMHNPKSPLLFGEIDSTDVIKERKVKSLINNQMNLFDL